MAPVAVFAVPVASVATTFTTHTDSGLITVLGIGSGGPKKQFASGWQDPLALLQSLSAVQSPCVSVPGLPFRQCSRGPAPWVQSAGLVPLLGPRVRFGPAMFVIAKTKSEESGIPPPATTVFCPPPK